MKRLLVYTAMVAPFLLLLALGSAAANAPTRKVKHVSRPIAAVAMDGPRVAYVTDDDAVRVWNVRTGATTQLRIGSGQYMDHPFIPEVEIAGTRVAWITLSVNGNSQETWARLYTRSLTGREHRVAAAFRSDGTYYDGTEIWDGNWLTGLVGSGDVLAVSRWTTKSNADHDSVTASNQRLSLIDSRRPLLRVIATGDKSIVSASADRSRVAVLRPDDSVGIYSAGGTLLKQITPSSAKEIAYGGGRLVVLTDTRTLEVYDAQTGALLHAWPIHTRAANLQPGNLRAYGRIGVYFVDVRALGQRMHVVDLATGKELVLPQTSHPWGAAGAAVGPLGLVYSVNTYRFGSNPKRAGTLVYLSTAKVLSMLTVAPKTPSRAVPIKLQTLMRTGTTINAFAQDGRAIAWIGGDARVRVRSLTSRKAWIVGKVTDEDRSAGADLALAGTRALWAWDNGGNDYGTALMTGSPGRRPVGAGGLQGGFRGFGDGERFTGLAGDSKTLAYGWVSEACSGQPYGICDLCTPLGTCPLGITTGGVTPVVLPATGLRPVIPNIPPPAIFALSQGRIAAAPARSPAPEGETVLQTAENGPVNVYDANGTMITTLAPHGRARALALCPNELAVLMERANGGKAIERYDPQTGRRIAMTRVISTTASELGVSNAGVVYRIGRKIYLFARHAAPRLVWQAKTTPIGLSIEGRRIAWAVNFQGRGRIVALRLPD